LFLEYIDGYIGGNIDGNLPSLNSHKDLENVVSRHQTLYSWQPAGAVQEFYILDDIEDSFS
jgi:hypothetical protein